MAVVAAGIEEPSSLPLTVDNQGSDKAGFFPKLRISAYNQAIVVLGILRCIGDNFFEHLVKSHAPFRRTDKLHSAHTPFKSSLVSLLKSSRDSFSALWAESISACRKA